MRGEGRRYAAGAVLIGILVMPIAGAASDPIPISSRPVSSAVVATWGADNDSQSGAHLEFLVLWRGTPGWLWPGPFAVTTKGTPAKIRPDGHISPSAIGQQISVGAITFSVNVDVRRAVLSIGEKEISLRTTNVVLVDGVDTAEGPRVVDALWVDPQLAAADQVQSTIQRSPELRQFLRCDARLEDSTKRQVADALCGAVLGRH